MDAIGISFNWESDKKFCYARRNNAHFDKDNQTSSERMKFVAAQGPHMGPPHFGLGWNSAYILLLLTTLPIGNPFNLITVSPHEFAQCLLKVNSGADITAVQPIMGATS